jgi:hypothetical protein
MNAVISRYTNFFLMKRKEEKSKLIDLENAQLNGHQKSIAPLELQGLKFQKTFVGRNFIYL